jgi:hypothetical protein
MIEQTVEQLTPIIGTRPACRAMGASHATIYRRRRPPQPRAPSPARRRPGRLSDAEREAVLEVLRSARFVDCAPAQVYATLLALHLVFLRVVGDLAKLAVVGRPVGQTTRRRMIARHTTAGCQRQRRVARWSRRP